MISTRSVELVIDTVVCLTLANWETVAGQFGGYLMGNIHTLNVALEMNEVQLVGPKFGIEVTRLEITKQEDIVPGLEALKDRVDGLYVCTDPLLTTYRALINTFAVREKLPTIYAFREY